MKIIKEHIKSNKGSCQKIYIFALGMLLVFLCCSCQGGRTKEDISEKNIYNMTMISLDEEFYNIIADNPIDKAFVSEDVSSETRIQTAVAYRNQWNAEIEYTMAILKDFLSAEDYQTLSSAYEAWEQYIQNTISVEQKVFYIGSYYKNEDEMPIGGNDTYPQVLEAAALRTKNYALELMSIEYAFTGNVEFSFRGN